jgi:hypothetical protein
MQMRINEKLDVSSIVKCDLRMPSVIALTPCTLLAEACVVKKNRRPVEAINTVNGKCSNSHDID